MEQNSIIYKMVRLMWRCTLSFTFVLLLVSCQKMIHHNRSIDSEEFRALTEQLIYGANEEVRIQSLSELTKIGTTTRYSALHELINASENNPEFFPRENQEKKHSLLKEILTIPLDNNEPKRKEEYFGKRMRHMQILNRMVKFTRQYRMYYEMAEILCQKHLYGSLWSQESLAIYKNKSAATEFSHAKNAAIANLRFLLTITDDERTQNAITKCLEEVQ